MRSKQTLSSVLLSALVVFQIESSTQSFASGACSQPSYRAATFQPIGSVGNSVTAGDFNLDGKPDVAVASAGASNVTVFLGNGLGGFSAQPPITVAPAVPSFIASADLSRDGKPDLITANFATDNFSFFHGNGDGTFNAPMTYATGDQPTAIAWADIDQNGTLDLIIVRLNRTNLSMHLGDGSGIYTDASNISIAPETGLRHIAVADFNRDGDPDLLISGMNSTQASVIVLNGNGSLGFDAPFPHSTTATGEVDGMVIGDFNADGRPDVVTANRTAQSASIFLGSPFSGNLSAATTTPIANGVLSVRAADTNNDGKLDLVFGKDTVNATYVLKGNGAGTFTASPDLTGPRGSQVVIEDFNLDGKKDLVAIDANVQTRLAIRLSSCGGLTTNPVPDFTGDGATDLAFFRPSTGFWYVLRSEDFTFFGFPFGTNGDKPGAGDYDGDGVTDAAVFRPSSSTWYIQPSSGGSIITQFGISTDTPIPSDYDGDGKTDISIYRPAPAEWWISRSTGGVFATQFGAPGDIPIQ